MDLNLSLDSSAGAPMLTLAGRLTGMLVLHVERLLRQGGQ